MSTQDGSVYYDSRQNSRRVSEYPNSQVLRGDSRKCSLNSNTGQVRDLLECVGRRYLAIGEMVFILKMISRLQVFKLKAAHIKIKYQKSLSFSMENYLTGKSG